MQHAYASFNKAIRRLWGEIVGVDGAGKPLVPIVIGHPQASAENPQGELPAECLRVYWLRQGGTTDQANEEDALVQLDLFVPGDNVAIALSRAAALNQGLGFRTAPGSGRLPRCDYSTDPPTQLSEMTIEPLEEGWVTIPDPKPRMVHQARTVILTYTV